MTGPFDSEAEAPRGRGPSRTGHIDVTRAVILVVAAVVLGVVLLHGITRTPAASSAPTTVPTTAPAAAPTTTTTTVPHSGVTVLVANGTSAANVALHYTAVLQAQKWDMRPATDTTATVTASNVYYAAGQQNAANEVATELGLKLSAVQPLTATVPVPGVSGADVVAVIGPDLAGQGFPAPSNTT